MIKLKFKSIKNSQLLQIQINQIFLITKITKKGYEKGHERYQNLSKEKKGKNQPCGHERYENRSIEKNVEKML